MEAKVELEELEEIIVRRQRPYATPDPPPRKVYVATAPPPSNLPTDQHMQEKQLDIEQRIQEAFARATLELTAQSSQVKAEIQAQVAADAQAQTAR